MDVYPATWATTDTLPGGVIKVGSVYYMFLEAHSGDYQWEIGIGTSNDPYGPWTLVSPGILNRTILGDGRDPEILGFPIIHIWVNIFVYPIL